MKRILAPALPTCSYYLFARITPKCQVLQVPQLISNQARTDVSTGSQTRVQKHRWRRDERRLRQAGERTGSAVRCLRCKVSTRSGEAMNGHLGNYEVTRRPFCPVPDSN